MFVAEVIETKMAFKPNQKDDDGNDLPLGSIQIKIGGHQSNIGQVRNIYARPAVFNRRIPLIGEQVLVTSAPTNEWSDKSYKNIGFMYFSPLNGTDDLVLHQFPRLWKRKGANSAAAAGSSLSDQEKTGYTFPTSPKKTFNIQPFEGDDIFEGRFGQSIRFGSSVVGNLSVYSEKPTWKGTSNADPIIVMRVKKSTGGSGNKYVIEDLKKDEASIYLTTTQKLTNVDLGFDKNLDVKQSPTWSTGPQILIDSERILLNAKKDMLMLIGAKKAILTGKKVVLQSDKYKVDIDDLMDFLKSWVTEDTNLASAKAMYSTASGPTGVSTNMANYIKLSNVDFKKFEMP
jgi:hypothetical protein